jgi:hypothetical protein
MPTTLNATDKKRGECIYLYKKDVSNSSGIFMYAFDSFYHPFVSPTHQLIFRYLKWMIDTNVSLTVYFLLKTVMA